MDTSVLALGNPMSAPSVRTNGLSPRHDSDNAFGEMLGRAERDHGPARPPSGRRPVDDTKPEPGTGAHGRTASPGAAAARRSHPGPRAASAGAVDQPVKDAPARPTVGQAGSAQEQPVDREDQIDRPAEQTKAEQAAPIDGPPPAALAPMPDLPGSITGLIDAATRIQEGAGLPAVVDQDCTAAEAVEGSAAAAVPAAPEGGAFQGLATPETPAATAAPAQPPVGEGRAFVEQDIPDRLDEAPDLPGRHRQAEAPPAVSTDRRPAQPTQASLPALPPDPATVREARQSEPQAAAGGETLDSGLAGRLAAMAEGLGPVRSDIMREAASSPGIPPAAILDAMRDARVRVSQVQPSPAPPVPATILTLQGASLADAGAAMLQDTAAAAAAAPILKAYERQAGAARWADAPGEFAGSGSELLRAALGAMAGTVGGNAAEPDSSSGQGSRRGAAVPLAQAAATLVSRATVGSDSSWALSMAAGTGPAAGSDEQAVEIGSLVHGPSVTRSIVQSVRVQIRQGGGEAHIRLNPAHLGELSVLVKVDGTGVSATLRAESPLVRSWLESHQDELKAALKEQGLSLDDLVIDADGRSGQQADAQAQQQRHEPPRRPATGLQFEVLI